MTLFNLNLLTILSLILPSSLLILILIKNSYKYILIFLLLIILSIFVIVSTPVLTLLIIIKILFLSRVTKLSLCGMQYEYIEIEIKLLTKKLHIFMLIIELIKIFVFIISYNFFKNYKKHNLYYLLIIGFFIISFTVIFLMLILLLNYKFNKDFKIYLLNNTLKFMHYFKNFRIEFHYGNIDFNFPPKSKTEQILFQLLSKIMNNSLFNSKNFLKNENDLCEPFKEAAHKWKNDNVNPEKSIGCWHRFYNKDVKTSDIFHYGTSNDDKTYACNVSKNIYNSELDDKYIKVPFVKTPYASKSDKVSGLIIVQLGENMIYEEKENLVLINEHILDLKMHLAVLETQEGVLEGWDLFNIEKIRDLKQCIAQLSKKLIEKEVFNLNFHENPEVFIKDTTTVLFMYEFSKFYIPNINSSNAWDIKKMLTNK